jgi:hypothetical protein
MFSLVSLFEILYYLVGSMLRRRNPSNCSRVFGRSDTKIIRVGKHAFLGVDQRCTMMSILYNSLKGTVSRDLMRKKIISPRYCIPGEGLFLIVMTFSYLNF